MIKLGSPASPNAVVADALVSPQDSEVGDDTDERGEHPHEDVAGADEPPGRKGGRDPRKSERTEGYPDSSSDPRHGLSLSDYSTRGTAATVWELSVKS